MNFGKPGSRWVEDEFAVTAQSLRNLGLWDARSALTQRQAVSVRADIIRNHPTFRRSANSVRVHATYDPRVAGSEFIRRSERTLRRLDVRTTQRDVAQTMLEVAVNQVLDDAENIEQLDDEIADLEGKMREDQRVLDDLREKKKAATQNQEAAEAKAKKLLEQKNVLETENKALKSENTELKDKNATLETKANNNAAIAEGTTEVIQTMVSRAKTQLKHIERLETTVTALNAKMLEINNTNPKALGDFTKADYKASLRQDLSRALDMETNDDAGPSAKRQRTDGAGSSDNAPVTNEGATD